MNLLKNTAPKQQKAIYEVARLLKAAGGRALLVGGFVRDGLFGIATKDVDIEIYGLKTSVIEATLKEHFRLDTVGRAFGVFILKGLNIDIALPRHESRTGPRHTDFVIKGDPDMSLTEAARRRDFRINAIYFDPLTEELLDPCDGINDLKNRRLRHVSDAFAEDPLRVLRGMQFVARFELEVDPETVTLCRTLTPEHLPRERLWEEWKKLLLKGQSISKGLQFLKACNWLQYFPEIEALVGCKQDPNWHPEGDVWTHTCHCLDAYARNRIGDDWEDLIVGIAVLCHDFGKPETSFIDKSGCIRSPNHDIKGVPIASTFLKRLCQQKKLFEEALPLMEQHMRPLALYRDNASEAAIRRLAKRVKRLDRLVRVAYADQCGRPPIVVDDFPAGKWLLKKADALAVKDRAPKPLMLGRHLIDLGLEPGLQFSEYLDKAYEAQLDGVFTEREGGIQFLRRLLAERSP